MLGKGTAAVRVAVERAAADGAALALTPPAEGAPAALAPGVQGHGLAMIAACFVGNGVTAS